MPKNWREMGSHMDWVQRPWEKGLLVDVVIFRSDDLSKCLLEPPG